MFREGIIIPRRRGHKNERNYEQPVKKRKLCNWVVLDYAKIKPNGKDVVVNPQFFISVVVVYRADMSEGWTGVACE